MELKEFVKTTLEQVLEAVKEVKTQHPQIVCPEPVANTGNGSVTRKGGQFIKDIEYDVAIVVCETSGSSKGAGIFVAGLGIGGQAKDSTSNSTTSRIRFSVPVAFSGDENRAEPQGQRQEKAICDYDKI